MFFFYGLAGVTAGADVISICGAMLFVLIAGFLVVLSAVSLDKLKLDNTVGAVLVHLTCGIWGSLAVGFFGENANGAMPFLPQLKGVLIVGVAAYSSAFLIFWIIDKLIGLRVSAQHEIEGMDSHEHGIRGYTIVFDE